MVDHEGHVKTIEWQYQQTGPHEGAVFSVVHDYLASEAPPELLGAAAAAAAAPQCQAAFTVCGLRLLEAALLLTSLGALAAWLHSLLSLTAPRQPRTPGTADDPAAPLVLADFPRFPHPREDASWPTSSNSSSVAKVEAFLRFAGLPYSKRIGWPRPASSHEAQVPYLQRGQQRIGGSRPILHHLVSSGAAPAALLHPADPQARATAVAAARMCDTDLAAAIVYERWVDNDGWRRCGPQLLGPYGLLWPVRAVVARMARKDSFICVQEQGIGRLPDAARLAVVAEELAALAALLGDKQFMFGDSPHAVDASVYGVLDQLAAAAMNPRLAELVVAHPNLVRYAWQVAYRMRIRERYFGLELRREVGWVDGGAQAGSKAASAEDNGAVAAKKEE